ncbi:MAG: HAD family hydrolase [Actinomycetota bacterium]|nr:HAD family hydrolase [Actinomycetota bacterium]
MPGARLSIVFDLDGTLLDVSSRHHLVYDDLVRSLGGKPLDKERYWRLKRSMATWTEILGLSDVASQATPGFLERFSEDIEKEDRLAWDVIVPSAEEVLDSLSQEHDLYLVSLRRSAVALGLQLEALGLKRRFREIVSAAGSRDAHQQKAGLVRTLVGDRRGVMVGDTEADVLAARALGMRSVAVMSGIRDRERLAQFDPDFLVSDVGALPRIVEAMSADAGPSA